MDPKIQAALDNPVVYTDEYRESLAQLAVEISQILGREVSFKSDGDYTTAFVIYIGFSDTGVLIPIKRHETVRPIPRYRIRLHISPKGPYFAYDLRQRDMEYRGNGTRYEWCEWPELPDAIQSVMNKVTATVVEKGYTLLNREQRNELVPGKLQKMDGLPATVNSELFTEV